MNTLAGGKTSAVRTCLAGFDAAGATALVASMAPGRDGSGKSGAETQAFVEAPGSLDAGSR